MMIAKAIITLVYTKAAPDLTEELFHFSSKEEGGGAIYAKLKFDKEIEIR